MFVLSHSVTNGQAYYLSMNETSVSLVASVKSIEVSLPSGDSGYFDVFYGGSFSGDSLVTMAMWPGGGGPVQSQPPVVFSTTASIPQPVFLHADRRRRLG